MEFFSVVNAISKTPTDVICCYVVVCKSRQHPGGWDSRSILARAFQRDCQYSASPLAREGGCKPGCYSRHVSHSCYSQPNADGVDQLVDQVSTGSTWLSHLHQGGGGYRTLGKVSGLSGLHAMKIIALARSVDLLMLTSKE